MANSKKSRKLDDLRYEALKDLTCLIATLCLQDIKLFYERVEGCSPPPQKKLDLRREIVDDLYGDYDPPDAVDIWDIRISTKSATERAKQTTGRIEQYSRFRSELVSLFLTYLKKRQNFPYRYAVAGELRRFFNPGKRNFRTLVTDVFGIGWEKFQERRREELDALQHEPLYDIQRKIERVK